MLVCSKGWVFDWAGDCLLYITDVFVHGTDT